MPMLQNESSDNLTLSRVFFSLKEVDDTSKNLSSIGTFSLEVST